MSATLLAEHIRRAAHGLHRCCWCDETIDRGERYRDQRIAEDGTVFTSREHLACSARFWKLWTAEGLNADDVVNPREDFKWITDVTT